MKIVLDNDNYAVISEQSNIDNLYYIMSIFEDIRDDIHDSKFDGFGECQIDKTEYMICDNCSWIHKYYID